MIIAVNYWKEEAWKNQGFNGIRTRDLRDTGAMLYQLNYEATHWERGQLIEFISSREEWNDVKFSSFYTFILECVTPSSEQSNSWDLCFSRS